MFSKWKYLFYIHDSIYAIKKQIKNERRKQNLSEKNIKLVIAEKPSVAQSIAKVSVDATIVADHIVLEAENLGLSSCWLTYFDPEIIRNEFNIPSNLEPIAIIALGYADTEKASPDRHSKDRKALESLVCYETF
jgi:nitroreductase